MKKALLVIALLVVAALILAACGRNGDDPPAATPDPVVEETPAPVVEDDNGDENGDEDVPPVGAPDFDEDMMGFLDYHFPATDLGGITLRWVGFGNPYSDNEVHAAEAQERRARVEERFNVTLEFIEDDNIIAIAGAWGDVPDVIMASVAAGNPVAHLFRGNAGYWFPTLANNGYLVNMDSALRAALPPSFFEFFGESIDGVAYGFNYQPAYSWNIMTYNRDMIRSVGMEMMPSDMFRAGRWSLDEFYEYLVELNALLPDDVNALGLHQNWWMRMAVFANGGYIVNPRTRVPGLLMEETIEPLVFLQRLVQDGLFIQPGWIPADNDPPPVIPGGFWSWGAAMIGGSHTELFAEERTAIASLAPWDFGWVGERFEFGIVPPPWGSNVTFPGDWRDLKTHTPYKSQFNDATANMIIRGTPDVVTPEVFINMIFTWYEGRARNLVNIHDDLAETGGILRLGSSQYLFTPGDVELWEWYASNSVFEIMDGSNFWIIPMHDAWLNTLGGTRDFRAAFEAVMPNLVWAMYEANILRREHIPAEMWALAEEFGANIPAEEDED